MLFHQVHQSTFIIYRVTTTGITEWQSLFAEYLLCIKYQVNLFDRSHFITYLQKLWEIVITLFHRWVTEAERGYVKCPRS